MDADARPDLVRGLGVREIPSIVMLAGRRRIASLCGRVTLGEVERALASRGGHDAGASLV